MQIITKKQADAIVVKSLFQPINRRTLSVERFDLGKYRGKPSDYTGREVQSLPDVHAVYAESRRDSDGPYVALFCLSAVRS